MSAPDFAGLARELLARADELVPAWLPAGRRSGREWICGDLAGHPGRSTSINLDTGRWADFSGTVKGGDLISLYAAIFQVSQYEAALKLGAQPERSTLNWHGTPATPPPAVPAEPAPPGTELPSIRGMTGRWVYADATGSILLVVCRVDTPGGKSFCQFTWRGGAWKAKGVDGPRPLYRLPELLGRPTVPVVLVEGERTADAAQAALGAAYTVTTWPGGAQSWRRADFGPLAGRQVTIWPDADEPGAAAAQGIAGALVVTGATVSMVSTGTFPLGWDAADVPAAEVAGHIERAERVEAPPPAEVPRETVVDSEQIPLEAYAEEDPIGGRRVRPEQAAPTLATEWPPPNFATYGVDFDPSKIPLRRWLLGNRRSVGEVTIDAGPPGVNKSTLMLSDAVAIATGRKILADRVHETGGVIYLAGEDARRDVEARLAGILQFYEIEPAELNNRLRVVYLAEIDAVTYTLAEMAEDMATLNLRMLAWLRAVPDTIAVFIDPLMAWHRLMENSNEAVQILSTAMRAIAVQGNRHVGIDHHVTKVTMADPEGHVGNLASVRGAGSLIGSTRWAFTLARLNSETATAQGIQETDRARYRRLDPLKTSYGPDAEQMRLLQVQSVVIANGESVPVLVEQDMALVQGEAKERAAAIAHASERKLAEALTRMLAEERPRSANAAALWLITRAPEVVPGKKGATLSEFTVRQRLPGMIGMGIPTKYEGSFARIIIRAPTGNGRGSQIDFEESD